MSPKETATVVVARCVSCGTRRDIHAEEVPKGEMPECKEPGCYSIMVAERAESR